MAVGIPGLDKESTQPAFVRLPKALITNMLSVERCLISVLKWKFTFINIPKVAVDCKDNMDNVGIIPLNCVWIDPVLLQNILFNLPKSRNRM